MNSGRSVTAPRKFHGHQENFCCLFAIQRFVDVQKSLFLPRHCLVNAQMADTDMSPATAGRTSAAFASSTKVDTTEQTTQLRTSDSTMSALTQSRSPYSFDVRCASPAPQMSLPLLAIRNKGRKRTSSGSIKELARTRGAVSEGEGEGPVKPEKRVP